jgi:hypothetical protein
MRFVMPLSSHHSSPLSAEAKRVHGGEIFAPDRRAASVRQFPRRSVPHRLEVRAEEGGVPVGIRSPGRANLDVADMKAVAALLIACLIEVEPCHAAERSAYTATAWCRLRRPIEVARRRVVLPRTGGLQRGIRGRG